MVDPVVRQGPPPAPSGDATAPDVAELAAVAARATDVPVFVSDPRQDGAPVVWANEAFTRAAGWSPQEGAGDLTRQRLEDQVGDPQALAEVHRRLEAGEPARVLLETLDRDGAPQWRELSVTPVRDEAGDVRHHVGVQVDVTARVLAERAAETARARLAVLADVGEAVAVLDVPHAASRLVEVLARTWPWAAFVLVRGDVRLAAVSGAQPPSVRPLPLPRGDAAARDPLAAQVLGRRPAPVAVRLESPVDAPTDPAEAGATPVGAWLAGALDAAGLGRPDDGGRLAVVVPVPGRDGVLALLVLGAVDPEGATGPGAAGGHGDARHVGADLDLVVEVARRTGLSLAAADLHEQQRLLAETLQRSMLPELPSVPGLDIWSYYAPGGEHAQVGGDWFDVMQPGGEGSGVVGVVVGDVVGHDVEAAAAMGQLRSVVRASAHEQEEPGTVLARVDQLVTGMRVRRSASLVYARLEELDDGTWEMAWSRAGALPPVLVQAGRAAPLEGGAGVLVGVGDRPRPTETLELGPGDVVAFCTDGLVSRRSRSLREGVDALVAACGQVAGTDAAGTGEHLIDVLGDAPEDDLAVVVVRVPSAVTPRPGPRRRRWQLPGEASSVARARRRVAAAGVLWGLPSTSHAELVVSELVANAVLHGWGSVGLRLAQEEGALLVEVDDSNPAPPGVVLERREGPGGYGLHVVQRLSDWGWRHGRSGKTVWARVPVGG
ncbi:ATP-binding SpoIIE family protein phosphatase [Pseudokineococcus sp. 1T1Z-3]|uniref:ATP-binding SpoIIE family protein phosphatase n=1 Tax=Pseudokineococcus sp. 1T1Z-3 TaxID=3132745 RepID=UPI0030AD15AF